MLGAKVKKYWWLGLALAYVGLLIYRLITIVPTNGFGLEELALIISFAQITIQNSSAISKLLLSLYFTIMNIQFRLKYIAQYKIPASVVLTLTDEYWVNLIKTIINENNHLKGLKQEIKLYKSKSNIETLITFMAIGINVKISTDSSIGYDDDSEERYVLVKISGDAHIKYRNVKIALNDFISSLFSKLESRFGKVPYKNYTLELESVENDKEYFKKLFIKGIETDKINNFTIQNKPGRYTINASTKRVYISSQYRDDLFVTMKNILFN